MNHFVLITIVLLVCSCKSESKVATVSPLDLPDSVVFRTATENFNSRWYTALREGRIWIKPKESSAKWVLLGKTGRPEGKHLVRFGTPDSIVEFSMDGIHITALSSTGHFYRGVNMSENRSADQVNWEDSWGGIGAKGSGLSAEWSTERGWSVSDCHPFGVKNYTDSKGTTHSVGFGTAHLYRLSADGHRVHYNDWWLPEDWSLQFDTPENGTVEGINCSVSGSTVFIISADGKLFTRLYDFDISGSNTLLTYSLTESKKGAIRALPSPAWKEEPAIPGLITPTITIFQTGVGNDARTLRVEGENQGKTGYYEKKITDSQWKFVVTNIPLQRPLLVKRVTVRAPQTNRYKGVLIVDKKDTIPATLENFSPFSSTGTLMIGESGSTRIPIYTVLTMIQTIRPSDFWEKNRATPVRVSAKISRDCTYFKTYNCDELVLTGTVSQSEITLHQIPRSQWFVAPKNRKGDRFQLILKQ